MSGTAAICLLSVLLLTVAAHTALCEDLNGNLLTEDNIETIENFFLIMQKVLAQNVIISEKDKDSSTMRKTPVVAKPTEQSTTTTEEYEPTTTEKYVPTTTEEYEPTTTEAATTTTEEPTTTEATTTTTTAATPIAAIGAIVAPARRRYCFKRFCVNIKNGKGYIY